MAIRRRVLYALLAASLIALLGASGMLFALRPRQSREYAVLLLDESQEDAAIGALLDGAGIIGYISESTQWVFWNDFSATLRQRPLEDFLASVESYDPRNDGYALALHAFFVSNGMRRFFIPLASEWNPLRAAAPFRSMEKRVAQIGLLDYSFEPLSSSSPFLRFFLLFLCAALTSLLFSPFPLIREPQGNPGGFLRYALPVAWAAGVGVGVGVALGISLWAPNPQSLSGPYAAAIPNAMRYEQHWAFQASFNRRPVAAQGQYRWNDSPVDYATDGYYYYYLGDDGLIAGFSIAPEGTRGMPPYPLEYLESFLSSSMGSSKTKRRGDCIAVLVALFFALPGLLSYITRKKAINLKKRVVA